jgi:hypothetical protein
MTDNDPLIELTEGMVVSSQKLLAYGKDELHHSIGGEMFLARVHRWEDSELNTRYALCSYERGSLNPEIPAITLVQLTVMSQFPDGQTSSIAHVFDIYNNNYMKMILDYPSEQLEEWSEHPEKLAEAVDPQLELSMLIDVVLEELQKEEEPDE